MNRLGSVLQGLRKLIGPQRKIGCLRHLGGDIRWIQGAGTASSEWCLWRRDDPPLANRLVKRDARNTKFPRCVFRRKPLH